MLAIQSNQSSAKPVTPSLSAQLKYLNVPMAQWFPDDQVDSFTINGQRLDISFKKNLQFHMPDDVLLVVNKKFSADLLYQDSLRVSGFKLIGNVFALAGSKKVQILSVELRGTRVFVETDGRYAERIEFAAEKLI